MKLLDDLKAAVTRESEVSASAVTLINGIGARIQAAVDTAIANGATESDLKPVQAEIDALTADSTALAAAVSANTSAAVKR